MWTDWFQKIFDWFQNPPVWFKRICKIIGDIVFTILKEAGKSYISQIENYIIQTNQEHPDATGEEKFNLVWDFAHQLLPFWKESKIDTLIQNLFMKLKETYRV